LKLNLLSKYFEAVWIKVQEKTAQQPIRTCIGCGQKHAQSTLMRIASYQSTSPVFDAERREAGRGVWLCRKPECVERAWQRHAVERGLKLKINTPAEREALAALKHTILRALSNENPEDAKHEAGNSDKSGGQMMR
jgi:predicted RNA-binding protein YlxR (DUF448 family)